MTAPRPPSPLFRRGTRPQVGRDDEFSINRQQMMARIHVCMGGTVAEELIFGRDQVTSGATDDLRQVGGTCRGFAVLPSIIVPETGPGSDCEMFV